VSSTDMLHISKPQETQLGWMKRERS